ncbi:glycosyltransferase family 2 protein [Carnobacterium gallinarum]|uniref:glycosyltransferase family 2 protein n=1 Tax=Carnobacterium gallinarum TaxID=2749 RepID=UPI00055948C6|nr:glycosyltransferase family 2 protein [Carnobacterium gallinarum]
MFTLPDLLFKGVSMVILITSIMVFFHLGFYTLLALIGLKKPKRTYEIKSDKNKFLFIVPAHNEEKVIQNCLESISRLDYDAQLVNAVILADHCEDRTAEIARSINNYTVYENTYAEGDVRGKPHVIGKYLKEHRDIWLKYDFIVFLDADNLVSSNYLKEINSQSIAQPEYMVIQGYLDSKNIGESMLSRGYAAAYFITNRAIQYSKHLLGWNASIGGTGFALRTDYIEQYGWNPKSYTEDFEIQVELSIEGKKSTWNHFAKVYDEKPNTLVVSHVQRTRWSQGHWHIAFTKTGKQLLSLVKPQGIVSWSNRLETLIYSYSMFRSVWLLFLFMLVAIDVRLISQLPYFFSFFWFWLIFETINYIVIPFTYIIQEGKEYMGNFNTSKKISEFFLLWVGYFYSTAVYYFAQIKGFFTWFLPQNHWQKTEHTSQVSSDDL